MKQNREAILKYISISAVIFIIVLVYRRWFYTGSVSSGDWVYKSFRGLNSISDYFNSWDGLFANGMGGSGIFQLALNSFYLMSSSYVFRIFHFQWGIIEKIVWFWPFLALSAIGPYLLSKKIFSLGAGTAVLSSLIYTTNTYALMLVGGGQMGVAQGYAMLPIVLLCFLSAMTASDNRKFGMIWPLIAGLSYSVQLMFDLRIAYVSLFCIFLLYMTVGWKSVRTAAAVFFIPLTLTLFLHFFWLLPLLLFRQNPLTVLGDAYSGAGMVKFLSFASFEHALSLMHPNWPENIFGKTGFLQAEFLILPLLAFSSMIFLPGKKQLLQNRLILYLVILGLSGAFLAKGANEPFGRIYLWFFEHVPGFMMFRDPTKWYAPVALSYSLLIPFVISRIIESFRSPLRVIIPVVFISFWAFTIRQGVSGQLNGTFAAHAVPVEYQQAEMFIADDAQFYRTLWVPKMNTLTHTTFLHPAMAGVTLPEITGESGMYAFLSQTDAPEKLSRLGVRYLIVPYDTNHEIFLTDRKYDDVIYADAVLKVSSLSWVRRKFRIGKIIIFETPSHNDRFWTEKNGNQEPVRHIRVIKPTYYRIEVNPDSQERLLVFSQSFDSAWIAECNGKKVVSRATVDNLNSFVIPAGGCDISVVYTPQELVDLGLYVSGGTGIIVIGCLFVLLQKKLLKHTRHLNSRTSRQIRMRNR